MGNTIIKYIDRAIHYRDECTQMINRIEQISQNIETQNFSQTDQQNPIEVLNNILQIYNNNQQPQPKHAKATTFVKNCKILNLKTRQSLDLKNMRAKYIKKQLIDDFIQEQEQQQTKCPICWKQYDLESIIMIPNSCNHIIHEQCIEIQINKNMDHRCPLCRVIYN